MIGRQLFFLVLLSSVFVMPVPSNVWEIKVASYAFLSSNLTAYTSSPIKTHIWTQYGLTTNKGRCVWNYQNSKNIYFQIYLYSDQNLRNYLKMMVYLDKGINFNFPFFNGTVHTTFQLYKNSNKVKQAKNYFTQPHALFNNQILTITENNGDQIIIQLQQNDFCFWRFSMAILLFLALKWILLLTSNIRGQVLSSNGRLSHYFVYALCGWQVYFHIILRKLIFIIQTKALFIIAYSGIIVSSIFVLCIIGYLAWKNMKSEEKKWIPLICGCFSGLLFMNVSFAMFSLILLFQIKLNTQRHQKYLICSHMFLIYLGNIGLILYIRGCPVNGLYEETNYYFCGIIVALVIAQICALYRQQKIPSVIYRKILTGKRETDQYVIVSIPQFNRIERLADNICSICLLPLVTTQLKTRISNLKGDQQLREHSFIQTQCNHFFHTGCIRKQAEGKQKCPLDRKNLPKIQNW